MNSAFPALSTAPSGATLVDSYTLDYPCTGSTCSVSFTLTNPTTISTYTFGLKTYTS